MRPELDDRDRAIIEQRTAALDRDPGYRVGDFVVFADGVTRRISHIWSREDWPERWGPQTSDSGSYHLCNGYVSHSGALHPITPGDTLTLTDERRSGSAWIFHHDQWRADNDVRFEIPFRVYRCSEPATL